MAADRRARAQSISIAWYVRVMTRHEQIKRLLQERLWTARVGWRDAAVPDTLLALARVPGSGVRVALDGLRHAFSCPSVMCDVRQAIACDAVNDVFTAQEPSIGFA